MSSFFNGLGPIILGAISLGLLWAVMVMGVYLTYRILDVADLSVEGTITLGAAVAARLITEGVNPWVATLAALVAGLLGGGITGILHTVLKIPALLSGILVTALISGLLQCLLFPDTALLGASGIVFMLIMLSSLAGMRAGSIPLTLILVGIIYLGQEVYSALFVQDNVAHFMHLVGGASGTAFGFMAAGKRLGR